MSRRIALVVAGIAAIVLLLDLNRVRRHDLRRFDAAEVARLETEMWRSYYDRRHLALFLQLSELLRSQYGFSRTQSLLAAFDAARAAVVFQKGSNRAGYERALPALRRYYARIQGGATTTFDAREAARLELEWWIVHRQRAQYGRDALARSLADLQTCIYGQPAATFADHAAARADAMLLRDALAERGALTDADWARIHELLDRSWSALAAEVASPTMAKKERK